MSSKLFLLAVVAFFALASAAKNPWCDIQICETYRKGKHTLCKYPNKGPSQRCLAKAGLGGGLTASQRDAIVDLHNELRQKVANGEEKRGNPGPQPAAVPGSMPNLVWDDTNAYIAQRWADQCDYGHDGCRDVDAYQVGQNVGYNPNEGKQKDLLLDIVRAWYDEVKIFDGNQAKLFDGKLALPTGEDIGHYTQLVWANTTKIGCGARNFYEGGEVRHYLVCDYGPGGNYPNQPLYKVAE